jgi:hypothetical protein
MKRIVIEQAEGYEFDSDEVFDFIVNELDNNGINTSVRTESYEPQVLQGFFTEPPMSDAQRAAEWKNSALKAQAELADLKRAVIDTVRACNRDLFPDELVLNTMTDTQELIDIIKTTIH